jgi:radical SAM superfamily enzyme YgiQ (UPF0313 family)
VSLMSLSTGDYPWLDELMLRLNARFKSRAVGLSLPSLRIDDKLHRLPEVIATVRKTGFTLAPEAGTEFMRKVIGKPISDADLIATAESAYTAGWRVIKLYYMIGLPGERDEDLHAIVQLSRQVSECARKIIRAPGNINATISPFVPKPHTPLQWEPMAPLADVRRKLELVRLRTGRGRIQLKTHECERSFMEAVFSRGDRRLWPALVEAHRLGCKFDEWNEHFSFTKWQEAFAKCGIDMDSYACRRYAEDDALPWAHIDAGIPAERLLAEYRESLEARKA